MRSVSFQLKRLRRLRGSVVFVQFETHEKSTGSSRTIFTVPGGFPIRSKPFVATTAVRTDAISHGPSNTSTVRPSRICPSKGSRANGLRSPCATHAALIKSAAHTNLDTLIIRCPVSILTYRQMMTNPRIFCRS